MIQNVLFMKDSTLNNIILLNYKLSYYYSSTEYYISFHHKTDLHQYVQIQRYPVEDRLSVSSRQKSLGFAQIKKNIFTLKALH